jgi:hypothetical protein
VRDLSAFDTVTMTFWHTYSLESGWDFGLVEVSLDGGETWESPLVAYSGDTDSGDAQLTWTQETLGLDLLAHRPNARIRFRLVSDPSITYGGWYIDDVEIFGGERTCDPVGLPYSVLMPLILKSH